MEKTDLVLVECMSIYPVKSAEKRTLQSIVDKNTGVPIMAWLTPDSRDDFYELREEVERRGGQLVISDMYRSYAMQDAAHKKWKKAFEEFQAGKLKEQPKYSPPPGGSFHQAGRAIDIDLSKIAPLATKDKGALAVFWELAAKLGWFPIINKPDPRKKEAWHFDHPGVFAAKRRANYRLGAAEAIKAINQPY